MPGRAQVSDGAATHGHCRATGMQPYTEHKGKLCVLLENKLYLQDVSSEKVACRVCVNYLRWGRKTRRIFLGDPGASDEDAGQKADISFPLHMSFLYSQDTLLCACI